MAWRKKICPFLALISASRDIKEGKIFQGYGSEGRKEACINMTTRSSKQGSGEQHMHSEHATSLFIVDAMRLPVLCIAKFVFPVSDLH